MSSEIAITRYEDEPQISHVAGQHTFDSNVVSDNSHAHFGDVHQYSYNSYSQSDAKDTVYRNTLAQTLQRFVLHPSMKGWTRYIPLFSLFFKIEAMKMLQRIEILQASIQRLQSIEQTFVSSRRLFEEVNSALSRPVDDLKVQELRTAAGQLLHSVKGISKSRCTKPTSAVCADEFCDLFERLSTQVKARKDIKNIINKLREPTGSAHFVRVEQESNLASNEGLLFADDDNVTLQTSESRSLAPALDQQEYLYANQDFWRQLNIVLSNTTRLRRRAWLRLIKTIIVLILIFFAALSIMRWFMFVITPEVFRNDFNPFPYIFAIFITTFYFFAATFRGMANPQLPSQSRSGAISLTERRDALV